MSFLAPGALWALLALAVPLAIHLRRRRVGPTIPVGSIRHLEPLPTAERRGLRLRDRRLFALRSALVALLAFLLAAPAIRRPAAPARPFILADSATPAPLLDSLGTRGAVRVERLDDPWRRVQELDDSLPTGVPLIIAASTSSERYHGPRPTVARPVEWHPLQASKRAAPDLQHAALNTQHATPNTPLERRALAAALAAAAEEFGPLTDSAGWTSRLPEWWRDSLAVPAFPLAVARAVAPARALPRPVLLSATQVTPRQVERPVRSEDVTDLHWWFWAAALLLFLLERRVAGRWRDPA